MSFQSILVHATDPASSQSRYRLAAAIALAQGARVSGIALSGAIAYAYQCGAAAAMAGTAVEDGSFLKEHAQRCLAACDAALGRAGASPEAGCLSDDTAAIGLPLAARYADLLLIGRRTPPDSLFADDGSLSRTVLVHAPCPVLVVPAGCRGTLPQRPLIAWDGSMEASRAVRAALPLLKCADRVTVVSFAPQKFMAYQEPAGQHLAGYLARHSIAVDLAAPGATGSIGHALLAFAADHAHDLIVMGCFGHSRFREIVLGGVTATALAETTVPLLMTH